MRQLVITRDLEIALHIYNTGVEKARREYAEHPLAICLGTLSTPTGDRPCMSARGRDDRLCRACRKHAAAERAERQDRKKETSS